MINNDTLEMLSAREQLMEDIDAIVTSQYLSDKIAEDDMEDLICILCDAVVKNFPTKWYHVPVVEVSTNLPTDLKIVYCS